MRSSALCRPAPLVVERRADGRAFGSVKGLKAGRMKRDEIDTTYGLIASSDSSSAFGMIQKAQSP